MQQQIFRFLLFFVIFFVSCLKGVGAEPEDLSGRREARKHRKHARQAEVRLARESRGRTKKNDGRRVPFSDGGRGTFDDRHQTEPNVENDEQDSYVLLPPSNSNAHGYGHPLGSNYRERAELAATSEVSDYPSAENLKSGGMLSDGATRPRTAVYGSVDERPSNPWLYEPYDLDNDASEDDVSISPMEMPADYRHLTLRQLGDDNFFAKLANTFPRDQIAEAWNSLTSSFAQMDSLQSITPTHVENAMQASANLMGSVGAAVADFAGQAAGQAASHVADARNDEIVSKKLKEAAKSLVDSVNSKNWFPGYQIIVTDEGIAIVDESGSSIVDSVAAEAIVRGFAQDVSEKIEELTTEASAVDPFGQLKAWIDGDFKDAVDKGIAKAMDIGQTIRDRLDDHIST